MKKQKNSNKFETIISKKEQMICPVCHNNAFVIKKRNDEIMCISCFYKKYSEIRKKILKDDKNIKLNKSRKPFAKLSKEQIESIRNNLKNYRKSIGKIKILYGGCFN